MSAAEDDLRGQLQAAFKEQREEVETPEVKEAAAPEESTTTERARDERGRFVANNDMASADAPKQIGENQQRDSDDGAADKAAPQTAALASKGEPSGDGAPLQQALAPPNGWPAEAKAKWHELPAEIMAAVQKREQDIAKFTSTRDEHASFGKEMYQAVQPYMALIKAEGATPASAVQSMLNTAYVLRNGTPDQKRNALLQTARQFGVELGTPAAPTNGQQSPELAGLYNEIAQLKGLLSQQQIAEQQRQQQAEQQQFQTVQQELTAFAADPAHPHFESVKGHMSALLAQGVCSGLKEAYDIAVWANPETRATLLAQQRAEEEQKRVAEAKRKAEEAKRRSISLTGGPGNTAANSAPEDRSLRDELRANFAASSGAV